MSVLKRQSLNILSVYFNKFSVSTQIFCQPTSSLLKQVSYKLVDISQKKMTDLIYIFDSSLNPKKTVGEINLSVRRSPAIFEWGKFLTFKFYEFFCPNLRLGGNKNVLCKCFPKWVLHYLTDQTTRVL